jgi:hypothetical protein
LFKNENGHEGGTIINNNRPGNAAGSSSAPINGLAKMQAQMAACASAAKQPSAPAEPTLTIPTLPQSSVTPEPELHPLPIVRSPVAPEPELHPPPTIRSLRPLQNAPSPSKSLAPSELTPDEVPSEHNNDDLLSTIKKQKKVLKAKRATGKTAKCCVTMIEESDDSENEELLVAKPTKSRGKRMACRK